MDPSENPQGDEDVLYDVLDRALSQIEDGRSVDVDALLSGRENLRAQAQEMVRLATRVGSGSGRATPTVPGYTVVGELGQGGMGTVYLARQERIGGRPVALKVLPPAIGLSERARRRFTGEALAIGKVRHPNIVAIYDVVDDRDTAAYAMEWVDGQTLAERIRGFTATQRQADIGFVCRLGVAIAKALAAVHRVGLVHRDVKPSNILIRADGTPLLSDFGLVREADSTMTEAGHFAGTVAYAAPEQLRGEHSLVDARSDVYSLGVTLFHALALQLPYHAGEPVGMLREIERGPRTALRRACPRIPRDVETIIAKAMDAEPARRYQTTDELADDLERLLSFQPIRARRAGFATRLARLVRRNRAAALGIIGGSLATLAIGMTAVIYAFFVPRWVATHVREARLELLDPEQGTAVFNLVFWNAPDKQGRFALPQEVLRSALRRYDAALRLAPFDVTIRRERDVVERAIRDTASLPTISVLSRADRGEVRLPPSDPRSDGLHAFLRGDIPAALQAWEHLERSSEPLEEPDPLVEAALGMLYLVSDKPARAYPRLRAACKAFPNVSFLTVYLADAAVQCDDLDVADRLLRAAKAMPRPDEQLALERVTADLLAARGRSDEAINAYHQIYSSVAILHAAQLLDRLGRTEEALKDYHKVIVEVPNGMTPRRMLVAAMDHWWDGLATTDRLRRIRAILDDASFAKDSLLVRLRLYAESRRKLDPRRPGVESGSPGGGFPRVKTRIATFFSLVRSPSLQKADLTALVDILEVDAMDRWARIQSYPLLLKNLQFLTWRVPLLNGAWRAMRGVPLHTPTARFAVAALIAALYGARSTANADPTVPPGFSMTVVAQDQPAPNDMAIAPPSFGGFGGQIFYTNPGSNSVYRVDGAGQAQLFATVSISPQYLAFGSGGAWGANLYVSCLQDPANTDDGRIVRIDASGAITTFGLTNPPNYRFGGSGVAFSEGGAFGTNLYTGAGAGLPGDCVSRISLAGGRATLFNTIPGNLAPGTQYLGSPVEMAFGPGVEGFSTNLYFSMYGTNPADTEGIFILNSSGSRSSFYVDAGGGSHPATQIDFGHGGAFGRKLYANQDGKIIRLDASAVAEDFITSPSGIGAFVFDGVSAIYVYESQRIWRIVPGCTPHTGDMNADGSADSRDIQRFTIALIAGSTTLSDTCPGDFSDSGVIDLSDTESFVNVLLGT